MLAMGALVLTVSLQAGAAPQPSGWAPPRGERVRLTTPTLQVKRRVGEFRGFGRDSLFIASGRDSIGFPSLVVSRLEVPVGTHRRLLLGGTAGAVLGMAAGVLVTRAIFGPPRECTGGGFVSLCLEELPREMGRTLMFGSVSVWGLVSGLRLAWRNPATRWQAVTIPGNAAP